MELKYEDFCSDPRAALAGIAAFCGLEWPQDLLAKLGAGIRQSNDKWPAHFSPEEIGTLNRVAGPLLSELGYAGNLKEDEDAGR